MSKKNTEKRYRWIRVWPFNPGATEVTGNYISDGNAYVNEKTGWKKHPTDFIEVEIPNEGK